jgi:hypothetical protein
LRRWLLPIAALILLSGCGGPVATATPIASATPGPPKATDAATVVARLKAMGLPIGVVVVFTAATDPDQLLGRPGQYVSKAAFADTRLPDSPEIGVAGGGSIERFTSGSELRVRKGFLEASVKASEIPDEYDYVVNLTLLRLSRALTSDQAAQYQQALATAAQ